MAKAVITSTLSVVYSDFYNDVSVNDFLNVNKVQVMTEVRGYVIFLLFSSCFMGSGSIPGSPVRGPTNMHNPVIAHTINLTDLTNSTDLTEKTDSSDFKLI